MASERPQYNFRPDARQLDVLESYREKHGASKSEAVKHYLTKGIEVENGGGPAPRAEDSSVLKVLVAQMAVAALAILMMGPGMAVIPEQAAWYVSLGLLVLAFWTLVAMRLGWLTRAQVRIRNHVHWAQQEAEA